MIAAGRQQLGDGPPAQGINEVRRNFGERCQDKSPLRKTWVGDGQAGHSNNLASVKYDVDIERARPFCLVSDAFVFLLDGEARGQ
jgi:hypothetical protein